MHPIINLSFGVLALAGRASTSMNLSAVLLVCSAFHLKADTNSPVGIEDLTLHIRTNSIARTNGGSTQMFSRYLDGTKFVRNPSFWLNGMNGLAAIQVGYGAGATAITPWHLLEANHFKNEVGSKVYFCDLHNN